MVFGWIERYGSRTGTASLRQKHRRSGHHDRNAAEAAGVVPQSLREAPERPGAVV
jgi:hypothetical protein